MYGYGLFLDATRLYLGYLLQFNTDNNRVLRSTFTTTALGNMGVAIGMNTSAPPTIVSRATKLGIAAYSVGLRLGNVHVIDNGGGGIGSVPRLTTSTLGHFADKPLVIAGNGGHGLFMEGRAVVGKVLVGLDAAGQRCPNLKNGMVNREASSIFYLDERATHDIARRYGARAANGTVAPADGTNGPGVATDTSLWSLFTPDGTRRGSLVGVSTSLSPHVAFNGKNGLLVTQANVTVRYAPPPFFSFSFSLSLSIPTHTHACAHTRVKAQYASGRTLNVCNDSLVALLL